MTVQTNANAFATHFAAAKAKQKPKLQKECASLHTR